jgi:hypothetical protein
LASCRAASAEKTPRAIDEEGVSLARFSTRDAAGCSRSCSASKSSPRAVAITISPSTTQFVAEPQGARRVAPENSDRLPLSSVLNYPSELGGIDHSVLVPAQANKSRTVCARRFDPSWECGLRIARVVTIRRLRMAQQNINPRLDSGKEHNSPNPESPAAAEGPSSTEHEPAQGHIQTGARYRDRPTDDGKHGDAAQGSIQNQ